MDYKERIKDLIDSIDDTGMLEYLYHALSDLITCLRAWSRSSGQ